MRYRYNPPPNWPTPPKGWRPPAGWTAPTEWGPPPAGWRFWLPVRQTSSLLVWLAVAGFGSMAVLSVISAGVNGADALSAERVGETAGPWWVLTLLATWGVWELVQYHRRQSAGGVGVHVDAERDRGGSALAGLVLAERHVPDPRGQRHAAEGLVGGQHATHRR